MTSAAAMHPKEMLMRCLEPTLEACRVDFSPLDLQVFVEHFSICRLAETDQQCIADA
jgi:hypothetical protein